MILRGPLVLCVLVVIGPLSAQDWRQGYVITRSGYMFPAEVKESPDAYFVRNKERGESISRDKVRILVTNEYADLIRNSGPGQAAFESFWAFNAAATYRYNPGNVANARKDFWTRFVKITLVAVSAFLYVEAQRANAALGRSYYFINEAPARARFRAALDRLNTASAITGGFFLWSAVDAYLSFDTDDAGNQIGIQEAKSTTIEEYIRLEPISRYHRGGKENAGQWAASVSIPF